MRLIMRLSILSVRSVVFRYFAPNGVSCCGNKWLLDGVIRSAQGWNRSDIIIESDCSAVGNMIKVSGWHESLCGATAPSRAAHLLR